MIVFLLFVFVPPFLFLLGVYIWTQAKKPRSKSKRRRQRESSPYNTHLQQKFLAMVGGDRATVQRLIEHEKQLNPGNHEDWYWEKAIYRLERDRNV